MTHLSKAEYPPLLSVGFHPMTVQELRKLCVDRFPLSKTRALIMDGLEQIVSKLRAQKITADIWVDGSFLTEKIDPEDSDIVLQVSGLFYDNAQPDQLQVIDWVENNLKQLLDCDSYLYIEYPTGHPWFPQSEWMKAYWIRQFGFSRKDSSKGMALIKL